MSKTPEFYGKCTLFSLPALIFETYKSDEFIILRLPYSPQSEHLLQEWMREHGDEIIEIATNQGHILKQCWLSSFSQPSVNKNPNILLQDFELKWAE